MKIVVMDGKTMGSRAVFDRLKAYGEVFYYERTPADLVRQRLEGAEIVFTNKTVLSRELIENLPFLRYIGVLATGYNVVDVEACSERGVAVTNIPTYGTQAVAQMTFALILELFSAVGAHNAAVKRGDWVKCADFCFECQPLRELSGKTIGLVGYGRIGRAVARIARAFDMNVIFYDEYAKGEEGYVPLDVLLGQSDIVSLHCPLTDLNYQMMNQDAFSRMKSTAVLINTARGGLVNEQDLADALNSGEIRAAAVDVISAEPMRAQNPLLGAKNIIITPHVSWAHVEAKARLMSICEDNLCAFLNGEILNRLDLAKK